MGWVAFLAIVRCVLSSIKGGDLEKEPAFRSMYGAMSRFSLVVWYDLPDIEEEKKIH